MEEIKPKQYVYKWIMTIFATSLPLRILSHVWDLYFLDGIFILYQTSLNEDSVNDFFEGFLRTIEHLTLILILTEAKNLFNPLREFFLISMIREIQIS
jgi:hypothetical protein